MPGAPHRSYAVGSQATVECEPGFTIQPPSAGLTPTVAVLHCGENNQFEAPQIRCSRSRRLQGGGSAPAPPPPPSSCFAATDSAGDCGSMGSGCPAGMQACGEADTSTPRCSDSVISQCCCAANRCDTPPPSTVTCPPGGPQCGNMDTFTARCSASVREDCCCESADAPPSPPSPLSPPSPPPGQTIIPLPEHERQGPENTRLTCAHTGDACPPGMDTCSDDNPDRTHCTNFLRTHCCCPPSPPCTHGRIEIKDGNGQWGTVCGHWAWDNDNLADIVCRGLGFAGGEIYTFGATTLPGFERLFPVTGYRTCVGSEDNVFQCMYCGNRALVASAVPGQPDLSMCHALDNSVSCCEEADDAKATQLAQCPPSLDQGATCYTSSERGHLAGGVLPCNGHDFGSTEIAQTDDQELVFGCIDFWSAYCPAPESTDALTYATAMAKFADCVQQDHGSGYTVTYDRAGWNAKSGYCTGALPNAAQLSNQHVCADASNVDIGFHIRIPFHVNTGGMYTFRMHADYGMGSFIGIDGAEHTPGNTWGHLQTDALQLQAGDHEFEALGFEDCCDGHAELEVHLPCDRTTSLWRVVTAGASACMTCGQSLAGNCIVSTSSAGQCGTIGQQGGRCPQGVAPCTSENAALPVCNEVTTSDCCCDGC